LRILAKTFAKVNPRLKILGKFDDGYHELDISFLSINLADRMTFESSDREDIVISTEAEIPPEENLCYRVARKLKGACSPEEGANISLKKDIPIGGGLGGGSSNAATTLICLNRLWDCKLSRKSLIEIGKEFGADVPFFFYGGYCIGTGKGYKLRKRENVFSDRLIPLIIPPFPQLTAEVYSKFDELCDDPEERNKKDDKGPRLPPGFGNFTIENDLQRAAITLNPELENYINLLESASTVEAAGLAGSGSSIFGISRRDVSGKEIKEELEKDLRSISEEAELLVVRPTNNGQFIRTEED